MEPGRRRGPCDACGGRILDRPALRRAAPGEDAVGSALRHAGRLRTRRAFRRLLRQDHARQPRLARRVVRPRLHGAGVITKACALAIPTVLIATGCVPPAELDRPPEVPVPEQDRAIGDGDEGMAAMSGVILPSFSQVSARWLLPATSPWAPYQKTTLLAALDEGERVASLPPIEELEGVSDAREAANTVATVGLPPDTMWVVDLRGAASVAFGAALSLGSRAPVAPVLTFNNWPAEREMVPAEETLAALVAMQPLRSGRTDGPPV